MINNKNFVSFLLIIISLYITIDLIFEDAGLFIFGSIIGGAIQELLKMVISKPKEYFVIMFWLAIVGIFIMLFFTIKKKYLKYLLISVLVILLYVINVIFASISIYDIFLNKDAILWHYLFQIICILLKSLIISVLLYDLFLRESKSK